MESSESWKEREITNIVRCERSGDRDEVETEELEAEGTTPVPRALFGIDELTGLQNINYMGIQMFSQNDANMK